MSEQQAGKTDEQMQETFLVMAWLGGVALLGQSASDVSEYTPESLGEVATFADADAMREMAVDLQTIAASLDRLATEADEVQAAIAQQKSDA